MNQKDSDPTVINCGSIANKFEQHRQKIERYRQREELELIRFTYKCPKNWQDLETTSDPAIRSCQACQHDVYYCTDKQEAEQHALQGHCIAVSNQLTSQVKNQYQDPPKPELGMPKPTYSGEPTPTRAWAKDLFDRSKHSLVEAIKTQEMKAIDLKHVDLSHVDLTGADLSHADLSYTNLTNTNLSYANLSYGKLEGVKVRRTNLSRANLSGVDLSSVIGYLDTFSTFLYSSDGDANWVMNLDGAILEPEYRKQYLEYLQQCLDYLISKCQNFIGKKPKVLKLQQKILSIRREIGDSLGEADTLQELGQIHFQLEDSQASIECFRQALSIKKENGDRSGEAQIQKHLGDVYFQSQDYQQTSEAYLQALLIQKELKNILEEAEISYSFGSLHFQQNNFERAAKFYRHALTIFDQLNKTDRITNTLNILIEIYHKSNLENNKHLLICCYQKILEMSKRDRDNQSYKREIEILEKIGDLYLELNNKQQALKYYRQGLNVKFL